MASDSRPLAVVTGASSGIGYELARCCVESGLDLLIAADNSDFGQSAQHLRRSGAAAGRTNCSRRLRR